MIRFSLSIAAGQSLVMRAIVSQHWAVRKRRICPAATSAIMDRVSSASPQAAFSRRFLCDTETVFCSWCDVAVQSFGVSVSACR